MLVLGCLNNLKNHCFYRPFRFSACTFTAVLIDRLQVMLLLMCTKFFFFCWITEGQIKHRKCGMEDRQRERKVGIEEAKRERKRQRVRGKWRETRWWDERRFCFALCYTLFTRDPLIFDMCLALFSASPSLASPSLWQLESGMALGVDTRSDNKT